MPHSIRDDILGPVLVGAKEAKYDKDDVKEVKKYGNPQETQEFKDLSLEERNQLQQTDREKKVSSRAKSHDTQVLIAQVKASSTPIPFHHHPFSTLSRMFTKNRIPHRTCLITLTEPD